MVYYVFQTGKNYFYKTNTLGEALAGTAPKRIFRRTPGIPNPWIVQEYQGQRGCWGNPSYLEKKNGKIKLKLKFRITRG